MPLQRLDHVNLRTHRLSAMVAWYSDVLGLETGPRPDFPFGGAWLYCNGFPIIHLVEVSAEQTNIAPKIEHFAISGTGLDQFLAGLEMRGIPLKIGRPAGFPIIQVNIFDPDGNHIHLDFPASDDAALAQRGL
jgi:catechol 2,3-dioxygenase-like lactoylglutathione lyase family enzyme